MNGSGPRSPHHPVLLITAQGAVRQVDSRAFRAERGEQECGYRVRQIVEGLLRPLVSAQVSPAYVSSHIGRRSCGYGFAARPPIGRRVEGWADGRASLQGIWGHQDPRRVVLPLRELREHRRVFVGGLKSTEIRATGGR